MITKEMLELHRKWLCGESDGVRLEFHDNARYANLCGADLCGADLCGADLSYSDLGDADLCGADLSHSDLGDADLRGADLSYSDLGDADLRGANLYGANLRGAKSAKNLRNLLSILPEGILIGYKKAKTYNGYVIITLEIPVDAKRSNINRKCRAAKAIVKNIEGIGFEYQDETVYSYHDESFTYEIGKTVEPNTPFEEDWTQECAAGIHFFITRYEAENY